MTVRPPLQAFCDWLHSLPPEHRREIAFLIVTASPGYGGLQIADLDRVDQILLEKLDTYSTDRLRSTGVALSLRALIEFFVVRTHGTRQAWDDNRAGQEYVLARLVEQGIPPEQKELFQNALERLPFRREQWMATIDRWKALCGSELSDESLDAWCTPRRQPGTDRGDVE